MINGIIVSAFSQIRETSEEKEDDKENICFICSTERKEFAKKKIDFKEHKEKEHRLGNYIKYFIYLINQCESDLSFADFQNLIAFENQNIGIFPFKNSRSLNSKN